MQYFHIFHTGGTSSHVLPFNIENTWQAVHSFLVGPMHCLQEKSHGSHLPSLVAK